jgi:hypothetical protein
MPVPSSVRFVLVVLVVCCVLPVGVAVGAERMPVGFFDDPSFRWSPDQAVNLAAAAAAGATVVHTTANWALIAPTRPHWAADPDDSAYRLSDLDQLVRESARYGLRVMVDITGTPGWANGGRSPNHMPTHLSDLATFAYMLALRYDGRNLGKGTVGLWSVWNEPNLQQFLTPQYAGGRIVSAANYARLYRTVYAAIKSANPWAKVAIGETSAQGRDRPGRGVSQTVAPGTFMRLLARQGGLRFDAWAQHPYPTSRAARPLQVVRYPNVTLAQLPRFELELRAAFHRRVPIWVTEFGYETRPSQPQGVSYGQQAAYARQALSFARSDPDVQMFVWFTFRDSPGNPWKSGLEQPSGAAKPSLAAFSSLAHLIDGTTVTTRPGVAPSLTIFTPYLTFYNPNHVLVGVTYTIRDGAKMVASGEPQSFTEPDGSVTFKPAFKPLKGQTYTVTATVNDANGNQQTRMVTIVVS